MSLAITAWAEEDKPREKLLQKGKSALSDAELLAILIGSGTVGQSAVSLAQDILHKSDNNLHDLGKKTLKELEKHKGIGEAKAITIVAAMELGRRRQISNARDRQVLQSSRDAYNFIAPLLIDLHHEEFWILLINQANEVFGREMLSQGGTSGTVVDVKLLFKAAIDAKASAIIAIHNHPSGSLKPSKEDIKITSKIKSAGDMLDIKLLDHLIVSERGYFSFADEGQLG
jgi:DNA repair protein RadC